MMNQHSKQHDVPNQELRPTGTSKHDLYQVLIPPHT